VEGVGRRSNLDDSSALITPREKLSIIMITTSQEEDKQHKHYINNIKEKVMNITIMTN
jgi:hypothetical protein